MEPQETMEEQGGNVSMDPYEPPVLAYDEVFPPLERPAEEIAAGKPITAMPTAGPTYAKMAVRSSTITQVFRVPLEERRYKEIDQGFGESNSMANQICYQIRMRTGASIEMSLAKDQSLTIVINGKPEEVMKAKRDLINKLQTQERRETQGAGADYCHKIIIPKPDDPNPDFIYITGTKEGIDRASHEIHLTSEEQAKRALERLSIPHVYHPFICGPGNHYTKELTATTGAAVHVPPLSAQKDEIVVSGEKDGVHEACQKIMQIYEEKKTRTTTVSLEVRKNQHKYVIGPKGSNITDILEKTQVSVEMPSSSSPSETITLRGEQDQLGPAISMVYAKANSIVVDHVQAESWLHRFIIGRKGKNIDNITQSLSKVHIEFAEGSDKIELEGPPEQVQEAKKHLEQVVSELRKTLSFDSLTINPRFVKHIIGKSGANVNRIKQSYGVSIRIPSEQENSGEIRIEGSPEGVAQAKSELSEMAQRMENEKQRDIMIEYRFHRLIIGQGGENIKEIREKFNQVQITFPSAGKKSDVVALRGPKGDVDKCYTFLQHMATKLTTENYEEQIPIMKQLHKNIIGRGGATINKIKDETDTRIEIPTENSSSNMITVTGRKENVQKAKVKFWPSRTNCLMYESFEGENQQAKFPSGLCVAQRSCTQHFVYTAYNTCMQNVDNDTTREEASYSEEIHCNPEYHRFLIGRGGANIRKDNVTEIQMNVDPKYHRHFVARRGQVLREIGDEYGGVTISFPRNGSDSSVVTIKGAKNCVDGAKQRIEAIVEDLEQQVTIPCIIPQKHHRSLMGPKGVKVQNITSQFDVAIKFPERPQQASPTSPEPTLVNGDAEIANGDDHKPKASDTINITGKRENCEGAKAALEKGDGIRQLMTTHDVNIAIPPADQQSDTVTVVGTATCVDGAVAALMEKVKELDSEQEDKKLRSFTVELSVDPKYHPKIIGRKGTIITKIRTDYDVNIQFPDRSSETHDKIIIQGYEDKAEGAKAAIEKLVSDLEKQIEITVKIDSRVHSRLIGGRGKTIRKIMEDFKVDIRFPRQEESDPNLIVIQGLEEDCYECKDHLLNLEEEYLQDAMEQEHMKQYMKPPAGKSHHNQPLLLASTSGMLPGIKPPTQPTPQTSQVSAHPRAYPASHHRPGDQNVKRSPPGDPLLVAENTKISCVMFFFFFELKDYSVFRDKRDWANDQDETGILTLKTISSETIKSTTTANPP
ncbi:putative vigilin [Apostichopus japonicus]|uniref:Putative vigilin n=1 Tax=Stichopus japonicus TaxID=307972 RepID=A0A2G8K3P8_STIJA|nr:putative vigilin [Apostichopus japonicus]